MLTKLKEELQKGIPLGDYTIYAKKSASGRFPEEVDLQIYLRKQDEETHLLFIKLFGGRRPAYRPWVELFSIKDSLRLKEEVIDYFDSIFEDELLSLISRFLEPGGAIYVEYYHDEETRKQLELGVPPPVTRVGYRLLRLGFTWFKDWYFPEGFMEGGQKLQAEKAPNDEVRIRQLDTIHESLRLFVSHASDFEAPDVRLAALERARVVLDHTVR